MMSDDQITKFQELFSLSDLEEMQYALECRFELNSELAVKLEKFIREED